MVTSTVIVSVNTKWDMDGSDTKRNLIARVLKDSTFFDEVEWDKEICIVKKSFVMGGVHSQACADKVIELLPQAMVIDHFLYGEFVYVEFWA